MNISLACQQLFNGNVNMNITDEDVLGLFNRLLEWLHQADLKNFGSHITIVNVASGAQHVETIQAQYVGEARPPAAPPTPPKHGKTHPKTFEDPTPLSALFWKSHHEALEKVLSSWQPYMTGETAELLSLRDFQFDLTKIRPPTVYLDLARLINHGALQTSMRVLAAYMFTHSNLSKSENALYVQLKRYKKLCK